MISLSEVNACKSLAEILSGIIPGGVMFAVIEQDTIVWTKASDSFDVEVLRVGKKLDASSTTLQAIREKRTLTQSVARSVYGTRLTIVSVPVVNDAGEAVGAFSVLFPKLHPVAAAFKDFAPILVEMFHEGSLLYMTDLDQVFRRQASSKFDVPVVDLGYVLKEEDPPAMVIRGKKPLFSEADASKFGVPVAEACFPLFDDEKKEDVVATFGVIIPKKTAATLRDMAKNLESGLTSIAAAIEELAASASDIHSNEQMLNSNIKDVINITEEINEVSAFIKDIADETKMLGLNAAIEAARAGEAGRGFGVVADEIRKLSDQSKSTVPKIKKLTDNIKKRVDEASSQSNSSLLSSQEQAAATEEITASIEEITSLSGDLLKIATTI